MSLSSGNNCVFQVCNKTSATYSSKCDTDAPPQEVSNVKRWKKSIPQFVSPRHGKWKGFQRQVIQLLLALLWMLAPRLHYCRRSQGHTEGICRFWPTVQLTISQVTVRHMGHRKSLSWLSHNTIRLQTQNLRKSFSLSTKYCNKWMLIIKLLLF